MREGQRGDVKDCCRQWDVEGSGASSDVQNPRLRSAYREGLLIKSPDEDLPQDTQQEQSSEKRGGFVMAQLIMDHPASGCFGTSLAPTTCLSLEKGPFVFPSLSDPRPQILTDKGHLGKGRTFGHGRLKRLQHRHRCRVVGPD